MGMFDYVEYKETDCAICGEPVVEYQSKSGNCELAKLTPAELLSQSEDEEAIFYGYCNDDSWNDPNKTQHCNTFVVIPPTELRVERLSHD